MLSIENFLDFLKKSSSTFHVQSSIKDILQSNNVHDSELKKNNNSYFITKDESIFAFKLPKRKIKKIKLIATHIDSPHIKIKLQASKQTHAMQQWITEIYGAPLLYTWLDRDLKISGKVLYKDKNSIQSKLIETSDVIAKIPSLAIHLQREINQDGIKLNPQIHFNPIISLSENDILNEICKENQIKKNSVLSFDLQLSDAQLPQIIGKNSDLISAAKLDNLLMTYIALDSFLDSDSDADILKILACFNHEEVGSQSSSGADSFFLKDLIENCLKKYKIHDYELITLMANSAAISADMAHGIHPNYLQKHDNDIFPQLGLGPVIKINSNLKYASDAENIAIIIDLCKRNSIPYQLFYNRQDLNCGSTVGPMMASNTGISTIDIGNAMLGMHSIRETASVKDINYMFQLMKSFFES